MNRASRWLVPGVTAVAALWSLLPFGVWWAGADPETYLATRRVWWWGGLISLGAVGLVAAASRGAALAFLPRLWVKVMALRPVPFLAAVGLLLAVLSVAACLVLFDGNPRNVDGFAQLFQARIFLSGRVWAPPPPSAEIANFATLHMVVGPDQWYAQYPPGQSVALALGLAAGAWWLLNPLFAALLAASVYRVARWCADESAARLSAILLCVSPFVVSVAGSEMSHLAAAALGMAAASAATRLGGQRWIPPAVLAGCALGLMFGFRPLDAFAAGLPVALIALMAAATRRAGALATIGLAGGVFALPTLWFNRVTTGRWLEFGYTRLWGPQHSLGFHEVPWGEALTPTRAVGLTGADLQLLDRYLFDAPLPLIAVVALALYAGRRLLGERDLLPVAGTVGLFGLLFFYWHRDWFYGPRLHFSAVPWCVVLVARGLIVLRRTGREVLPGVTTGLVAATWVVASFALGLLTIAPGRLRAYRDAVPDFRLHPDREARRAGISDAVVVVPDGWGARLIVRMWSAGVPVPRSSRLYAAIDACTLEQTLDSAERSRSSPALLLASLDSLAALGRPGVRLGLTPDPNLRLPPDTTLTAACAAEIETDRRGFVQFAPFLYFNTALLDGDLVWARDMGTRNAAILSRYSGRRFYRYAPGEPEGPPVFTPLDAR